MSNSTTHSKKLTKAEWHGWMVIVLGLGGFLLWAGTYPMQQGVPCMGFVVSQSDKLPVVAHMTGLVARLPIKLGDEVKAGDVLLEFDSEQLRSTDRALSLSKAGLERSAQSLKSALRSRNEQLDALRGQYKATAQLVDAGFASSNYLATLKSQLALSESELLELQSKVEQMNASIQDVEARIASVQLEKTLLKLKSPVDGHVMNMGVKSAGVNVILGTPIMEIAPQTQQLWVDARVPVEMGDRVKTGMSVSIMFPTLEGSQTQRLNGFLSYLSADRLTDPRTGQVYLEARIGFNPDEAPQMANLRAGLPASAIIDTGPRTLMNYILRPLTERVQRGMQ